MTSLAAQLSCATLNLARHVGEGFDAHSFGAHSLGVHSLVCVCSMNPFCCCLTTAGALGPLEGLLHLHLGMKLVNELRLANVV